MTFWIDAQLNPELAEWIGAQFKVIAKSIREMGLRDATDREIFDAARRFDDIVMITKDADFVDLQERLGPPPRVVWLTVGNLTTVQLRVLINKVFASVLVKLEDGAVLVEVSNAEQ